PGPFVDACAAAAVDSAHRPAHGQFPRLDYEGRAGALGGDRARNAQCRQDHRRPHLRLYGAALHGRRALPHYDPGRLGRRAPARHAPPQARIAPQMTDPIIKFDKVGKSYGSLKVLDGLDFEVKRGEKVTIIGPSGSGKSTVLRVLMTLETINDGVVYVGNEP